MLEESSDQSTEQWVYLTEKSRYSKDTVNNHSLRKQFKSIDSYLRLGYWTESTDAHQLIYHAASTKFLLTSVHIWSVCLTLQTVTVISKAQWLFLKQISLPNTHLTHQGIALITQNPYQWLQTVDFSDNPLTNRACSHLARTKWPRLMNLSIRNCRMTKNCLRCLQKAEWPELACLDISHMRGCMDLKFIGSIPWPKLHHLYLGLTLYKCCSFYNVANMAKTSESMSGIVVECSPSKTIRINSKKAINMISLKAYKSEMFNYTCFNSDHLPFNQHLRPFVVIEQSLIVRDESRGQLAFTSEEQEQLVT